MMGVTHQRRIHVEQCDPAEAALEDLDGRRHGRSVRYGLWMRGDKIQRHVRPTERG